MARSYKHFMKPRTVFYALCLILATVFPSVARAADDSDLYTVTGVTVDITADSAVVAREQAFDQAQVDAFRQLADRLLSEEQAAVAATPDAAVISTMVKDFEITDERLSNVRYIGTYTFRFKSDAVRNHLGMSGLTYTDVGSKPVLVLPYYQWGARTILWDKANPWFAAWNGLQSYQGLVPVVAPIGDLQDVSDMSDSDALTYRPENLDSMVLRYAAGRALVLVAVPEWSGGTQAAGQQPDRLTVMAYRTENGRPEFSEKIIVERASLGAGEDIFAAAVQQTRKTMQQDWKTRTQTNASEDNALAARVRFETMQEWVETQQALRNVPGVNDVKLLSLTPRQADIQLLFQGGEDRLRLALAQADVTLTTPQVDFSTASGGSPQGASPLAYDLYLNKYGH